MNQLSGKVALITGAGRGIGRASALQMAKAGANLILISRTLADLEALEAEIRPYNVQSMVLPADVTKPEQVAQAVEEAIVTFGHIDILVNAAGVGVIRPFLELSLADFDFMLDVNLRGTFLVTQAVAAQMLKQKRGLVVNIPGILGKTPMMNASGYCASKFAVTGLTRAAALDLKRYGVRFSLLHLGGVDSPFWDNIDGMRVQRDKMLTVEDAARAVLYAVTQPDTGVLTEMTLQPESHQL